mmetsp:Transcript_9503/g.18008  ORF Transcript_9503/g.18008 Transcript_9503/m.18008 type:complete len:234 (+) Transcript_9503:34-735(+)
MIHWVSCMLLTFGPPVILYNSSQLSTESALRSCNYAGAGYIITQIIKFFVLATFLPSTEVSVSSGNMVFDPFQEVWKTGMNVSELLGISFILGSNTLSKFDHDVRVLCVGLGWSMAESLVRNLIPLWIGASGTEFSWEYLQQGLEANTRLLLNIVLVASLWLRSRTDLEKSGVPVVWVAIGTHLLLPSFIQYLTVEHNTSFWVIIALRLAIGIAVGLPVRIFINRYLDNKKCS